MKQKLPAIDRAEAQGLESQSGIQRILNYQPIKSQFHQQFILKNHLMNETSSDYVNSSSRTHTTLKSSQVDQEKSQELKKSQIDDSYEVLSDLSDQERGLPELPCHDMSRQSKRSSKPSQIRAREELKVIARRFGESRDKMSRVKASQFSQFYRRQSHSPAIPD